MTDAQTKMSVARARLLLDYPFFGVLALKLGMNETTDTPTLATNGQQMFYNPEFITQLPTNLCSSAIAHEVMHAVMNHNTRRSGRNPRKWNVACDFAINPILKEAGLPLGEDWLHNPNWADMSAEEIYNLLPDDQDDGHDPLCDVQDTPGDAEARESQVIDWKIASVQAATAQAKRGKLPGSIQRILDDAISPPVLWREVLAQFMTERVKNDYSWARRNPYYANTKVILPALDGVGMGEIVIALDTSGSVANVLDEFGQTVRDILASTRPRRTHVVYCDARVNRVDMFEQGQELTLEAVGGGGTDFRPVFEYVKNNSIYPACMLYLTDMYGAFPNDPPSYPVLWCATSDVQGPFGQTLKIEG